jgi:hypothetical protein
MTYGDTIGSVSAKFAPVGARFPARERPPCLPTCEFAVLQGIQWLQVLWRIFSPRILHENPEKSSVFTRWKAWSGHLRSPFALEPLLAESETGGGLDIVPVRPRCAAGADFGG